MDPQSDLRRLRKQRNLAAVAAVVIITVSMAICLPYALDRRKRHKSANDELLALQAQIENTQNQIRGVQAQILQTQSEIRSLIHERH